MRVRRARRSSSERARADAEALAASPSPAPMHLVGEREVGGGLARRVRTPPEALNAAAAGVADGLEQHAGRLERRAGPDLAGRGLQEVGARARARSPAAGSRHAVAERAGLEDHLQRARRRRRARVAATTAARSAVVAAQRRRARARPRRPRPRRPSTRRPPSRAARSRVQVARGEVRDGGDGDAGVRQPARSRHSRVDADRGDRPGAASPPWRTARRCPRRRPWRSRRGEVETSARGGGRRGAHAVLQRSGRGGRQALAAALGVASVCSWLSGSAAQALGEVGDRRDRGDAQARSGGRRSSRGRSTCRPRRRRACGTRGSRRASRSSGPARRGRRPRGARTPARGGVQRGAQVGVVGVAQVGKRGPSASSFGPASGLRPVRLMWSVIAIEATRAPTSGRSEPAAFVRITCSAPSGAEGADRVGDRLGRSAPRRGGGGPGGRRPGRRRRSPMTSAAGVAGDGRAREAGQLARSR